MGLVTPSGKLVVPTEGWISPRGDNFDVEKLEFLMWPCPVCGKLSDYSLHYAFERDTIAFRCPKCGLLEVKR